MLRRLVVLTLLSASAPLAAQSVLHEWSGPRSAPFYGSAVSAAGDLDGDGYVDLVTGDPFGEAGLGLVELRSGRTGALLEAFEGALPGAEFGAAVAGGADIDGDGVPDVLVGEPLAGSGGGRVHVLSGADGSLYADFESSETDAHLGRCVAFVGDVNGDGFVDVGAGAPRETPIRAGAVHVWSGRDGTTLRHWLADGVDDQLGSALAAAGDIDADGRPDVVAGAPQSLQQPGYVDVWSGFDGTCLHHLEGDGDGDRFGCAVAGIGDMDADGFADVAVGMPGFDQADVDAGGLAVYSGLTGGVLRLVLGLEVGAAFGSAVAAAGDIDNDGVLDVAGADRPYFGGGVTVSSGADGGELLWLPALGEASLEPLDRIQVVGGFDANADGVGDLLLGVSRRIVSPEPGLARLVSSQELPWTSVPEGALAGAAGAPFLDGAGIYEPGGTASLRLFDAPPSAAAVFVVGFQQLGAPFKGGTLVPSPDLFVSGLVSGADGTLSLLTPLPADLHAGTQVVYQAWLKDTGAPKGWSATNGLVLQDPQWLDAAETYVGDGVSGQLGSAGKAP